MTTFINECGIQEADDYRKEELRNIQIGQTFVVEYQEQKKLYMRIDSNNLLNRIYSIEKEVREEHADKHRTFCYVDLLTGIVYSRDLNILELYRNCDLNKGQLLVYKMCELNPKNQ